MKTIITGLITFYAFTAAIVGMYCIFKCRMNANSQNMRKWRKANVLVIIALIMTLLGIFACMGADGFPVMGLPVILLAFNIFAAFSFKDSIGYDEKVELKPGDYRLTDVWTPPQKNNSSRRIITSNEKTIYADMFPAEKPIKCTLYLKKVKNVIYDNPTNPSFYNYTITAYECNYKMPIERKSFLWLALAFLIVIPFPLIMGRNIVESLVLMVCAMFSAVAYSKWHDMLFKVVSIAFIVICSGALIMNLVFH